MESSSTLRAVDTRWENWLAKAAKASHPGSARSQSDHSSVGVRGNSDHSVSTRSVESSVSTVKESQPRETGKS